LDTAVLNGITRYNIGLKKSIIHPTRETADQFPAKALLMMKITTHFRKFLYRYILYEIGKNIGVCQALTRLDSEKCGLTRTHDF
jgi:hypothetical protein